MIRSHWGGKQALRTAVPLLSLVLLMGISAPSTAQRVPISFNDYHGYTGTVEYLQRVARAYPDITELLDIGRSNKGRTIHVLVITNRRTGTTIDQHVELRNMRRENVQNVPPGKPFQGKPGFWIDGGTHGNEYTGTEVCLYIIDKLVSGYGSDPALTGIIDQKTIFVCPIVNPDGVYNSVEADISQRQNSMDLDDDEDGRINEDGPDDLNGDGHITSFRYRDPEGQYVMDAQDPRVMIRLGRGEETDQERWSVVPEDRDNDGDGRRGEDGERGIDVNRNFPEGWFNDDQEQGGSGYYPSSSPEAHAILEFFTNNTSILFAQSFHTSGGFTYRPFARWPDSRIAPKDLAVYDRIMGKKYCQMLGVEYPASWDTPPPAAAAPAARGMQRQAQGARPAGQAQQTEQQPRTAGGASTEMPREWRQPYNTQQDRAYGYGIFIDWAYAQYGAYSMTTELWNRSRDFVGMPEFEAGDSGARERWLIQYQQENFGGDFFLPWTRYRHPELGDGEIGGWIPKYTGGNAFPGEPLAGVCETHWQFELFKMGLLPKVELTETSARVLYTTNSAREATADQQGDTVTIRRGSNAGRYRIVEVTATVANTGQLATHLARGANLAGNRDDAVWLVCDRDRVTFLQGSPFQSIGTLEGVMDIPGYTAAAQPAGGGRGGQMQMMMQMMPPGMDPSMFQQFMQAQGGAPGEAQEGNTRQVRWLIAIEGDSPLKIVVTSQKGGTVVREVTVR